MPEEFQPKNAPETKPLKVEQPKEPPKEVLDIKFSLDDLPKNGDVAAPIQLPKVERESEKKHDATKPEDRPRDESGKFIPVSGEKRDTEGAGKTEQGDTGGDKPSSVLKPPTKVEGKETAKVEGQKAEVRQVAPQDPKAKKERDYTGFSAEEVTHLKAMSNEAFAYTSKLIKDNKELAKLKDGSFLQHPDAYILTPDYQNTIQEIQRAEVESKAWRDALVLCEEGKAFKTPIGFNKQTGQLVFSEEMQPTADLKVQLADVLSQVNGVKNNLQGKLSNMGEQFKQRVATDRQMAQAEREKRFAWVAKPEMLDWTVATKAGDIPIKQIKEDFKAVFPPYDRSTVGVEVAADLMVAFLILEGELQNALAGKTTAEVKMEEVKRAEPSSDAAERQIGTEIGGVKHFSLEGLPK